MIGEEVDCQYRVVWRRLGREKMSLEFPTLEMAQRYKLREEKDVPSSWQVPPLVFGPVIERRVIGPWEPIE